MHILQPHPFVWVKPNVVHCDLVRTGACGVRSWCSSRRIFSRYLASSSSFKHSPRSTRFTTVHSTTYRLGRAHVRACGVCVCTCAPHAPVCFVMWFLSEFGTSARRRAPQMSHVTYSRSFLCTFSCDNSAWQQENFGQQLDTAESVKSTLVTRKLAHFCTGSCATS